MSTTTPTPTPVRSRRRWYVLGAFALLFLAVPLGYMLIGGWLRERQLQELYTEIEADDPNWRWADLIAELEPAPDEENAFTQMRKVRDMLKITAFSIGGGWDADAKEKARQVRNARLSPENAELLRGAFQPLNPQIMPEARKLKDFPRGRLKIDPSINFFELLIEDVQHARDLMRLLDADIMLRLHDNDMEGAAESWHALLNTSHAIEDNPTLIGQLVRMAGQSIALGALERMLGQGELSEADLAKIQSLLERERADNLLYFGMRGERAGGHQLYEHMRDGKMTMSKLMNGNKSAPNFGERAIDLFPGFILRGYPEHLRLMTEQVKLTKLPEHERAAAMRKIEDQVRGSGNMYVRLIMPASMKVGEASQRTQAMLRSAQVAVAAERHRLKSDTWPRDIDELVQAGLLKDIPNDPYDGKALRFKHTPTGIVIYSVASDKTDNQGLIDRARPGTSGSDIGFELWDRQLRAVAPPAEEEP
jgi:hypothetical protein